MFNYVNNIHTHVLLDIQIYNFIYYTFVYNYKCMCIFKVYSSSTSVSNENLL